MNNCSFCSNTAIEGYSINYEKTGLVHHCRNCAVEFGLSEQGYQQTVDK